MFFNAEWHYTLDFGRGHAADGRGQKVSEVIFFKAYPVGFHTAMVIGKEFKERYLELCKEGILDNKDKKTKTKQENKKRSPRRADRGMHMEPPKAVTKATKATNKRIKEDESTSFEYGGGSGSDGDENVHDNNERGSEEDDEEDDKHDEKPSQEHEDGEDEDKEES
jgi:hypothetical protein